MTALCAHFPSLRGVPGTEPWEVVALLDWLVNSGAPTSGSRHAALFVLSVWSSGPTDWEEVAHVNEVPNSDRLRDIRFDLTHAWAVWDDLHRDAVLAWLLNPFYP